MAEAKVEKVPVRSTEVRNAVGSYGFEEFEIDGKGIAYVTPQTRERMTAEQPLTWVNPDDIPAKMVSTMRTTPAKPPEKEKDEIVHVRADGSESGRENK